MTTPGLEVLRPRAGAAVVVLTGEHDLASKSTLSELLDSLLVTHELVVADLSQAVFIDSSTLAVFVTTDRAAREQRKRFRLQLGTEPIVKRILEISGLVDHLDCAATREEALL
jgi:anti-anti-sigma factor